MGSLYAALNRYGMKRAWKAPAAPLNVLITGSTKGLGKGLAREFLRYGFSVAGMPFWVILGLYWKVLESIDLWLWDFVRVPFVGVKSSGLRVA